VRWPTGSPAPVAEQHAARRARLASRLAERDLEAALVTSLVNVRYLCGFTGSNAALLVRSDATTTLATDGRYPTQVAREAPDVELVLERDVAGALAAGFRGRRLGFEEHVVTVAAYDALRGSLDRVDLVPLDRVVEDLRAVKDDGELALILRACASADAALADVLAGVGPGMTEREIAWALEDRMRAHGADRPAFDTIVAAGPHSAIPHHEPTSRPIARGDLLKLDFGAEVAGYRSDMTRTVAVGEPAAWQVEVHAVVAASQQAGRDAVRAGATPTEVDAAARAVIEQAGYALVHGLGHGVGLEIHESPLLGPGSTAPPLAEGTVLTVEPGIYLPDRGGVRIEDTVVVRADAAEPLTSSPRDLLVL
jgi:Xaa-Pro aminopeptidase